MANTVFKKTLDLTNGYVCDSEPVSESENFLLSGAIYDAIPGTATTTVAGTVLKAAAVAEAAGDAPTAAEFKALLDALKAAGIMATN